MHHRTTHDNPTPTASALAAPSAPPLHHSSLIIHRPGFTRPAFTLVELMVSVAMVVLLLFGIHQVFRMSSNTIGTGQAVNAVTREIRATQTVMQEDFRRSLKESPLFVISSQPVGVVVDPVTSSNYSIQPTLAPNLFHFTSRAERDRDIDRNPATIDLDGDGTEETSYTDRQLARVNDRIHRSDIFGFFARGLFNRQTANDGLYVSATKAYDAWIWYGHVKLPDPVAGGYWDPGAIPTANPESEIQFASNWVLGRRALLLKDFDAVNSIGGEACIGAAAGSAYRGPLAFNSPGINAAKAGTATGMTYPAAGGSSSQIRFPTLAESRLDVVGTTLEGYRNEFLRHRQAFPVPTPNNWWAAAWWNPLVFRYECDPKVRKPITSANLAKTTPYFVAGVSQFIVEFAGDFLSQNNDVNSSAYGLITAAVPDGVIDFIVMDPRVDSQTNPGPYPDNPRVRRTRWYGLPRDANGDGLITARMFSGARANAIPDVVPVYDVMLSSNLTGVQRPPFEVAWPAQNHEGADGYGSIKDPRTFRYVCAWTDGGPAMVRIVIKLEDPAGRLADGHWAEFVLDAP